MLLIGAISLACWGLLHTTSLNRVQDTAPKSTHAMFSTFAQQVCFQPAERKQKEKERKKRKAEGRDECENRGMSIWAHDPGHKTILKWLHRPKGCGVGSIIAVVLTTIPFSKSFLAKTTYLTLTTVWNEDKLRILAHKSLQTGCVYLIQMQVSRYYSLYWFSSSVIRTAATKEATEAVSRGKIQPCS